MVSHLSLHSGPDRITCSCSNTAEAVCMTPTRHGRAASILLCRWYCCLHMLFGCLDCDKTFACCWLCQLTFPQVLKKLMKLPWSECEPYLLKCLMKVSRVRFQDIALIASLAGGLSQYHDSLGVGLVDLVLEDVRWVYEGVARGVLPCQIKKCCSLLYSPHAALCNLICSINLSCHVLQRHWWHCL